LGKIKDVKNGIIQKVEILCALQKLGEKLSEEEEKFLILNISNNMKQFELASDSTKIGIFHIFKDFSILKINKVYFIYKGHLY